MSTLLGIAVRPRRRAPMSSLEECAISREHGVADDTRGRPGSRQVTVLSLDSWRAACSELGAQLDWTTRRANLLVEGVDLQQSTGMVLHVGDIVELLVTGELEPCGRMDQAYSGLRCALEPHWRGGVTCKVVVEGNVRVGDAVSLREPRD